MKPAQKVRKSVILGNILQREQYQPKTTYLVPLSDNNEILTKKNGLVVFRAKCSKTARKVRKSFILQNLLRSEYINWKPPIWSKDKIITKFGQKNV